MSLVKFATICDHCGARSREYECWPACRECADDVCTACIVPGTHDDEPNDAVCKDCREGTWETHQVGCDWLWDAAQDCNCGTGLKCTEEDECDCEHNCRCCQDEDCPRHGKGAPYEH